ncbi:MAG: hypothetical protein H8D35_05510 [Nitrosopumilus sp.]|nr:hypothetical protein [Nitrosopumilus sp.]
MTKSLGDYNIEKSSSSDVNNISWSQKNQNDDNKPRKKKIVKEGQMPSGINIIYKKDDDEEKTIVKKVFIIEDEQKSEKTKEEVGRRFENTSAILGTVKERAYKRPGR